MSLINKVEVRYVSIEFPDFDIHLRTLKNKQQFLDINNESEKRGINSTLWSIFGVLWPAGEIMAHLMCTQDIENKKILEVGCGIGLSSLVLNHRGANITATDYHPEVKVFLEENVQLNNDIAIEFHLCDWKNKRTTLGKFDLIIASDVLYQENHSSLLSSFIDAHANDNAEVIIVSPNRGYQNRFTNEMERFSYTHEKIEPQNTEYLKDHFKGHIHKYKKY